MIEGSQPDPRDAWLDLGQAAALVGLSTPRLDVLLRRGELVRRDAPSGRAGVMKHDLLAWRDRERDARRIALVEWIAEIDREIFG